MGDVEMSDEEEKTIPTWLAYILIAIITVVSIGMIFYSFTPEYREREANRTRAWQEMIAKNMSPQNVSLNISEEMSRRFNETIPLPKCCYPPECEDMYPKNPPNCTCIYPVRCTKS
jgi:hypothetical protein